MNWISNWIQGIIVAVIIGTIIEMILPEGNCKKYIKVVIGVYILFSVISPVITKITGNEFRVSDIYDINTYIEVSAKTSQKNIETSQENQIKKIYEINLKNDIKQKVEEKGYKVSSLSIKIADDEKYTLKQIYIQINSNNKIENINNEINVTEEINIEIGNNIEKNIIDISLNEQNELKKYLASVYNLEEKNININ